MTIIFRFINKFLFRFLVGYAIMIWLVRCDYAGSRRKIIAQTSLAAVYLEVSIWKTNVMKG